MSAISFQAARGASSQQVLREIYHRGTASRADLVRVTGLTAPTISEVVQGLLNQGLIEEIGQGPSTGGKRPTLLRVVDDSRQLIGLDLARGDFRGAVMNLRGEIQSRVELPLNNRASEPALQQVYDLAAQLTALASRPLLGIGIGAPGLVDPVEGVVCHAVNVDWRSLPLASLLSERCQLPVYLANDCQAAALAESLFGGANAEENLVVVNVGYGVGAGIVVNGRLLHGSPYGAGEIGHMVVDGESGVLCRCGNYGCLETVASSRAILRRARASGVDGLDGLDGSGDTPSREALEIIRQRSESGDPAAREVIAETGRSLGIAVGNVLSVLGRSRVLFAGGAVSLGEGLLEAVRAELPRRTVSPIAEESLVGFAASGNDIVLRGAAVLVLAQELGLM